MKKIVFGLLIYVALVIGVICAEAKTNNDTFTVRFRENTLVVTSIQMEGAAICSMEGKTLQKKYGQFLEFPLDRGNYRLYAKVNGKTISRRIELR